jgi:Ca2+-transporting ATPase
MRSIRQVQDLVPTTFDAGLDSDGVAQSLVRFGPNRLTSQPREPQWRKFLEKFDEPIIKILLAAAVLSIVVDLFKASPTLGLSSLGVVGMVMSFAFLASGVRQWAASILFGLAIVLVVASIASGHPSYEGFAVMVAVVLATGVAFISEYRSDREFEILNTRKAEIQVKVTRSGVITTAPLDELVVGDLVLLEMGDEVPADGRLIRATDFVVNQSLMTGESAPVRKHAASVDDTRDGPEHDGCVYRGTQVVDGVGQMMVTEVGDETMLGKIAQSLSGAAAMPEASQNERERIQQKLTISKQLTPLQHKLADLAGLISRIGYFAASAIFIALVGRGLLIGAFSQGWVDAVRYLLDSFMYMVIVIVVAVPEGLPMSVTICLALAMRKMTRANSLVRQLVACETIGSATVICTDKTGTLTQNRMQVDRVWWDGSTTNRGAADWERLLEPDDWSHPDNPAGWIALISTVNSTANLELKDGARPATIGNSTEGSLLAWLHEYGVDYRRLRTQFPPLAQVHFSSERKRMTTVVEYQGRLAALLKGAPDIVATCSTHYLAADGTIKAWEPDAMIGLQTALQEAAGKAMRTLAFGFKFLPESARDVLIDDVPVESELLATGFVFAGFAAIRDPLRGDAAEAIRECRRAGIEVKMITGDSIDTARAIAHEVGLMDSTEAIALTHDEFEAMPDERLQEVMPNLRVLARARPLDKVRIVQILQSQNHVVAMTGDGTNDAPALKQADVGLAMGITGTEVAKEASKIVLLDDSFATIVKAVNWGRSLYENIQRFLQFQLTINVSALTIAFLGPFLNVRPPFTILQLLWINVLMDTFASIALCSEPARRGVMRLPPKRRDENIVSRSMLAKIAITGTFLVVVMLVLLVGMKNGGWFDRSNFPESSEDSDFAPLTPRQVSIFFTVYVSFLAWNQINCRSLTPDRSALTGLFRNRTFLSIASLTLIGQFLIVTFGYEVFKVRPLSLIDWLIISAGTSSVLILSELIRLIRRRFKTQVVAAIDQDAEAPLS